MIAYRNRLLIRLISVCISMRCRKHKGSHNNKSINYSMYCIIRQQTLRSLSVLFFVLLLLVWVKSAFITSLIFPEFLHFLHKNLHWDAVACIQCFFSYHCRLCGLLSLRSKVGEVLRCLTTRPPLSPSLPLCRGVG